MKLKETLLWLANRWVEEHAGLAKPPTIKTLSVRAADNSKALALLESGERTVTIDTWEKVVSHLAQRSSWASNIPDDVVRELAALRVPLPPEVLRPDIYRTPAIA